MELFTNQILAGIATGAIYACMALAVVMIYQAIDHLNFAQGEMAMFSTFVSWQLMQWGIPYWWAFLITLAFSFAGGIIIENVFFLPGLGRLVFQGITQRDLIVVKSVVMLLVFAVILVNFLVDVTYGLVDPRLRRQR